MRQIVFIISIICSFGILALGQNEKADWQTYISPKDEFLVETPQKLEAKFEVLKDIDEKEVSFEARYKTKFGGVFYFIFSDEAVPEKRDSSFPLNSLKKFMAENKGEAKSILISDLTGVKVVFKDSEDFVHQVILIDTKKRSYIFHTVENNAVSSDSERFMASIKINNNPISNLNQPPIKSEKPPVEVSVKKISPVVSASGGGGGIGTGQGSGSGSGSGVASGESTKKGNGIGIGPVSPPVAGQTSPLKILSKASPPYTDLARIYDIQGTVTLRVTFLADGSIGSVSPINKLPFGLTNNAMSAARVMRFEPAAKDGVAYPVTKQVQYNFTLY